MKFHLSSNTSRNIFKAHGVGYVLVNDQRFQQPLIVTSDNIITDWPASSFAALTEADFAHFLALKPEVLILGTGQQHLFAHPKLFQALTAEGIGVECMSTPAACRTYNILMEEERRVVAAILFE